MSYINRIQGHHSLHYSMLNPGLPAQHNGHKPINQYTCDYCIERHMFTLNWASQIHISTSAGYHQRMLAKMANYSGTEPQKNFTQAQAKDVNSQMLVLSSYMTLICLTILLMILVTLASLRLHLWTWILVLMLGMCWMTWMDWILEMMNPRTQTPMQKTTYLILRITHCIIYMISSVQWVVSLKLGWRGGHRPTWQQRHRGWHPSGV